MSPAELAAWARADASKPAQTGPAQPEPAQRTPSASDLALPDVNGPNGMSADALKLLGLRLPEWQWGLGNDLQRALYLSGTPKPVNMAQEVSSAVRKLRDAGHFDDAFHRALMDHQGRVTMGVYNLIRNQMLLTHGIDRRTFEAQTADANPVR